MSKKEKNEKKKSKELEEKEGEKETENEVLNETTFPSEGSIHTSGYNYYNGDCESSSSEKTNEEKEKEKENKTVRKDGIIVRPSKPHRPPFRVQIDGGINNLTFEQK